MLLMEKAHRAPEVEYRSSIDDERREEIARHVRWAMAGLALLGFLLRVGAIFYLKRWQFPNAMEHQTIALSLLQNGTFYFRAACRRESSPRGLATASSARSHRSPSRCCCPSQPSAAC